MKNKIINKINSSEIIRNYILGIFNLGIGLGLLNLFQYFLFQNITDTLKTDLSITFSYIVGVSISYFLTIKYVFRATNYFGSFKKYSQFFSTNLLNYFVPILVWYLIELRVSDYSQLFFNIVNLIVANIIFPLKFLVYKYFIFVK